MSGTKRTWRLGWVIFAGCFVVGFAVWWASLSLVGTAEPWDAAGIFYTTSLFVTGFIVGCIAPRWIWAAWAGVYAGQFLGALFVNPRLGPLAPLGLLCFLPAYSLVAVAGAALGAVLRIVAQGLIRKANDP